jgi:transcriptional regulator with XRE-family HTH domain
MGSRIHPLTAYRKRADLTLEAFAARVGTTKSWLSRIEAHLVMPSTSLIERMVRESGGELSANDFFSLPAGVAS